MQIAASIFPDPIELLSIGRCNCERGNRSRYIVIWARDVGSGLKRAIIPTQLQLCAAWQFDIRMRQVTMPGERPK